MYTFNLSSLADSQFENLVRAGHRDKILATLMDIADDPLKRAKPTKKPILGTYYINTGTFYCALVEIDDVAHRIDVLQVIPQSKLYRLLK